jgi:hypothetical protein
MCLAVGGLVVVGGRHGWAAAAPSAQALRFCVDRWNQGNMISWGSMSVRISLRSLDAHERGRVSFGDDAQRRCTVSLAGREGDNSWICRIGDTGGYECPLVTSDGMPPLKRPNGTTDSGGVLRLDVPLKGTHATPPLRWQRRYPHVGWFHPALDAGREAPSGSSPRRDRTRGLWLLR